MPAFIDMTGQRVGRLTVIQRGAPHKQSSGKVLVTWICRCDCGNIVQVLSGALRCGGTKSCGCYNRDSHSTHGASTKNGKRTKTYRAWGAAKERCYTSRKPNDVKYYQERGIKMCERWRNDFGAFLEDMGECPDGYSLERLDYNKNYEPENCAWIPRGDQARNRRTLHVIEHEGERHTLAEWARRLHVPYETIRHQYVYRHMPFVEIVRRARGRSK